MQTTSFDVYVSVPSAVASNFTEASFWVVPSGNSFAFTIKLNWFAPYSLILSNFQVIVLACSSYTALSILFSVIPSASYPTV